MCQLSRSGQYLTRLNWGKGLFILVLVLALNECTHVSLTRRSNKWGTKTPNDRSDLKVNTNKSEVFPDQSNNRHIYLWSKFW